MDYWLLSDKQNNIVASNESNFHEIDLNDEKMINHPPLIICSFRNTHENNVRTEERLFPNKALENVIDPRPVTVGLSQQDLRKEKLENEVSKKETAPDFDDTFNPVPFNENIPALAFTPGKAEFSGYAATVDVESRLKRIDYSDNKCYVKEYNPYSDIKSHYGIIKKDYRVPVRTLGENKCSNLETPDKVENEYQFELGNTAERFFYNNTRRKTQNDW